MTKNEEVMKKIEDILEKMDDVREMKADVHLLKAALGGANGPDFITRRLALMLERFAAHRVKLGDERAAGIVGTAALAIHEAADILETL